MVGKFVKSVSGERPYSRNIELFVHRVWGRSPVNDNYLKNSKFSLNERYQLERPPSYKLIEKSSITRQDAVQWISQPTSYTTTRPE
ncbi:unnamed protein product [Arctia plantaginis]|uniref:Uncharacterized protein n=1 Tax=Arctia plantaginis TaxID=874455 RepID=A0A8S1B146_ARCPL|nr:unnamed protein product [Arctia plantaginis]CAB3259786.1 unnamed protein product [Arctia plantaginis]